MEDTQDENIEQFSSPCSSEMGDTFGNPEVLPRVGEEFQAKIPSLIAVFDCLQLINTSSNSKSSNDENRSSPLELPIPLMWLNTGVENINETVEFENSEESQITSNNEYPELKVEPVHAVSGYGKNIGVLSNIQQAVGSCNKTESDLVAPQESKKKVYQMERGLYPLPGSLGASWTDVERDSFLLGLYIYGKNLVSVKKFVESKQMGDILSFYYGEFYRSKKYCRWSECRKRRSRRSIIGQKIFMGWRQQELLSRLISHVSHEYQSTLLEVSRTFAEGKTSFDEYVSTLKSTVGINMLIEAVGIGKGKHDLTGIAMDPVKPNHAFSVFPEIPTGKACSSLTSADIIRFLTGGFRLSKARSNDLFWEAVWPRLLAKGWHSEQPKDNGFSGSKHSLVFLIPRVKKFSRRRLVKGKHYFDSISDVLNKIASEPGVLELEIEAANGSQYEETCGSNPSSKQDQDILSNNQHRSYLRPCKPNHNGDVHKFTIVDTSLVNGAERPKVRELKSLSFETTSLSTSSSLSSETEGDTSEDTQENQVETNTSNEAEDVTDGRTCADSSDFAISSLHNGPHDSPDPTIALDEDGEKKNRSQINDKEESKVMKFQFSRMIKSGCSKYLVPIKQESNIACDLGEWSCSTKHVYGDGKLNQDDSCYVQNSPDACEGMIFQGPPQNLSSANSLAKDSPAESNEVVVGENCLGKEASSEKLQSPKLIDLNIPPIPPDFAVLEHITRDTEQNNDNLSQNSSSFLSGTNQRVKPFKPPDAGARPGQQPAINIRRQSTRNRPLTTKALEALELGFFSTKKKRKSTDVPESNCIFRCSRQVHRKTDAKAAYKDGGVNDVADSKNAESSQGFQGDIDMVDESPP